MNDIADDDVKNWDKVCSGDGVSIYKKMTDDSPVVLLKVYAFIDNAPPDLVIEVMSNEKVR